MLDFHALLCFKLCPLLTDELLFPMLQGQSDLLRGAKTDSLDALRQLALACEACGLISSSSSSSTFSTTELCYSSQPLSGRPSSTHGNGRI